MSPILDHDDWETANGRFLAASLAWIRLLLRRRIDERAGIAVAPRRGWPGGRREEEFSARVTESQIATAAADVTAAADISPPPALVRLAGRLGLSRFERDTLLLCAAVELDPAAGPLCARAHGDEQLRCPTFGLALAILPNPAWEAVAPCSGLRRWRLIDITQRPGEGILTAGLRVDERILNYLKGLDHLDIRLTPLVTQLEPAARPLPPSQQRVAEELAREWRGDTPGGPSVQSAGANARESRGDTLSGQQVEVESTDDSLSSSQRGVADDRAREWRGFVPSAPIIQLAGAEPAAKQLVTAQAAAHSGLVVYRLPAALLPAAPVELDELARLWEREAVLAPLVLYLDAQEVDEGGADRPPVERFLTRVRGRCVLASRESWSEAGRRALVLDVAAPTADERAVAWREALSPGADAGVIDALSAQFALEDSDIREVARTAGGSAEQAWRACRARTRPRMDALAQRLEPRVGWDDIVLPDAVLAVLHRITDQVSHRTTVYQQWGFGARISRGLGVSVLFAGPSGTGKTMAAEVLAAQLKLDLYRIDPSEVVDKYIGETEKKLRRVFDAAERGGAMLFFDEADSYYGRRSEVKDSHDRYANIQINYLLQRMETYRGLAILATNLRSALDPAFLRRLRFIVDFPFPGIAERKGIWERSFPTDAPVAGLDFDRLARLPVSGGMARNIAVNAAFLAAARGGDITMREALAAARTEFEKLELPIRDRDFVIDEVSES
ncbi:ATP-binding protein [Nocardia sp. CDC159]|uniref:ATP-binding protein n=1 Tax=Nocardia pulmonis TaxID=2951408 RepID=A0A9X2E987_9NOCA|nr:MULTISPECIES: ATP-binding protein [Nocardia]MCM6776639.1 ATP-binding protein [Nocardia pulmonis]MCM6789212.1 ATP-binding protein [Nocardia sp. CDC159]